MAMADLAAGTCSSGEDPLPVSSQSFLSTPGRTEVFSALNAYNSARDGLAGVITNIADSQVALADRVTEVQDRSGEFSRDLEKVFRRLHQLEARQVSLIQNQDAKIHEQLQQLEHKVDARIDTRELEQQVAHQQSRIDEALEDLQRQLELARAESRTAASKVVPEELQDSLRAQLSTQVVDKACRLVEESREALQSELGELSSTLQQRIEALAASSSAQKEQAEVWSAKIRVVEQRSVKQSKELQKVMSAFQKHDLLQDDNGSVTDRLKSLEEYSASAKELVENFQARFSSSMERLDAGLEKLDTIHQQNRDATADVSKLQEWCQEQFQQTRHFETWAKPLLADMHDLPEEVKQLSVGFASIGSRQDRCDNDVNKLSRLGRILDDKVETFDSMERRMEELSSNAQKLMGGQFAASVRCLGCADHSNAEPDTSRQWPSRARSPSPPLVNAVFEGENANAASAGWSRQPPPKRPHSAGARRICDVSQQELSIEGGEKVSHERATSKGSSQAMVVLTVPQVRTELAAPGTFGGICGKAYGPLKPKPQSPAGRRRPMSARARIQSSHQDRLAGS